MDGVQTSLPADAGSSARLAAQRIEIHSLWNSWSWRIFRPLRNLLRRAAGHDKENEPAVESVDEAARTLAAIHQSLSWRLTAPLRTVHRAFVAPSSDSTVDVNHRPPATLAPPSDLARQAQIKLPEPIEEDYSQRLNELRPTIAQHAARFSVSAAVDPTDHIFRYIIEPSKRPGDEENVRYYFEDGANSARQLAELVKKYCGHLERKPQVMEFASGYGCVTRHLALNKNIDLESCDIHPAAIDFLQTEMGVLALQSSPVPETLHCPHQFDFVFALSFFSHMPISTWTRWLVRLTQCLRPGGAIAFTTHGVATLAAHGNPEIGRSDFTSHLPASKRIFPPKNMAPQSSPRPSCARTC